MTCEHRIDPPIRFRGFQIGQASCARCGRHLAGVLGDATCSILRSGAEHLRFTQWGRRCFWGLA
jgi:hypothetical protein